MYARWRIECKQKRIEITDFQNFRLMLSFVFVVLNMHITFEIFTGHGIQI